MPVRNQLVLILHWALAQPLPKASATFHLESRESRFPANYRKLQRWKHRSGESLNTALRRVDDPARRVPALIVDHYRNGFPRRPRRLWGPLENRLTRL